MNLVRLRRVRGWSQEDLAYEAGLHRTFVGHVERRGRNISLDNIERLAYALGVPLDELLRSPEAPQNIEPADGIAEGTPLPT